MKKVTAGQIAHGFNKLNASLQPGESVQVTDRGVPVGQYTKIPVRPRKLPNFLTRARQDGHGPKVGDALLQRLLADHEAIS